GYAVDSWQKKALSLAVTAIAIALGLGASRLVRTSPAGTPERTQHQPRPAGAHEVAPQEHAPPWGPRALVGPACGGGLVLLHGETLKAVNLNDSAFHLEMVRWASGQISEGRVPFDGWFPYLSLGSSHFHHYQSLPHTLTAYTSLLTGAGDQTTYLWFL